MGVTITVAMNMEHEMKDRRSRNQLNACESVRAITRIMYSGMIVQNLANFIRFIASTYIKLELRFRFSSMFTSKSAQVSKLISCDELNSLVFKQLLFESILSLIESFRIKTFEHLGIFTNIL